jgi:hypothetical protein
MCFIFFTPYLVSNKKINYQEYDSKIEQVINEPIEEDLKKICDELSFN